MKPIRLIAMDMDGTLLNEKQQISAENLQALREAVVKGVHIAICSGRTAADVSFFATDGGLEQCGVIALNGACCLPAPHQKPYAVHYIKPETVDRTLDVLLKHRITFAAFQQERVIVLQNDPNVMKPNWGTHVNRKNPEAYVYGEQALQAHKGEGICKIVYIDKANAPRIARIQQELEPLPELVVTSSWNDNLELMPTNVNKGTALKELAERLGLQAEQVMAIGDYDNDLDMLAYAGLGVAMGNASDNVMRLANVVTKTNREHGVAEAIRRYVLTAAVC